MLTPNATAGASGTPWTQHARLLMSAWILKPLTLVSSPRTL